MQDRRHRNASGVPILPGRTLEQASRPGAPGARGKRAILAWLAVQERPAPAPGGGPKESTDSDCGDVARSTAWNIARPTT